MHEIAGCEKVHTHIYMYNNILIQLLISNGAFTLHGNNPKKVFFNEIRLQIVKVCTQICCIS